MDESAPITWLIGEINKIVSSGADAAASAIATTVTPLASICFGIYILLICLNYMRGAETEPIIDFGIRCAGFAVVIGLGLNAANYTSLVIPMVTGIGSDLASAISRGNATAGTLDQLALHYFKILEEGYDLSNKPTFPSNVGPLLIYVLKAAFILVGLIPFLVAATLCLIVADVGSVIVAMVGPLYFAFLIFPATRQYFSSWLNTAFSYALIPIFVAVIATISVGLSKQMFSANDISFKAVFMASMGNLTLLFLLRQVGALASSLSAGGINVSMPGSANTLRNAAQAARLGAKGIQQGGRTAINAGKAAGRWAENRFNSIRKAG
ncbi:MAG: type IV secretion system protein [Xylella fastidiosa subsp. multiplex]|uniref:Type IV secretion system protein n=1 Tax=Xylella fastidiosa subsp. multiplex TaxID=644357 RepID=A0AAW6HXW5_XYLFS|nr:type IV secretion system protein [Xylella fastidiosa]MDC6409616.1 type IV secretion system protein [Xylella fastidiosa subsp. multiplex]MDD0936613.1 type IV secretion system protein [Xylella fastidiosa subsp. multiplex]MSS67945.1 type IV secretion system protein [Xylella fastidiosa subsp. multiplex]UIT49076.1 type IV secretion system protein [Xylella fastidiosa subsp. multiplex]